MQLAQYIFLPQLRLSDRGEFLLSLCAWAWLVAMSLVDCQPVLRPPSNGHRLGLSLSLLFHILTKAIRFGETGTPFGNPVLSRFFGFGQSHISSICNWIYGKEILLSPTCSLSCSLSPLCVYSRCIKVFMKLWAVPAPKVFTGEISWLVSALTYMYTVFPIQKTFHVAFVLLINLENFFFYLWLCFECPSVKLGDFRPARK